MKKLFFLLVIAVVSCSKTDNLPNDTSEVIETYECSSATFPEWSTSNYVLPYPIGKSYQIGLGPCTGSYHHSGKPDQFAIDFNMPIGSIITSSTNGEVVYVEESGIDYQFPNNLIIVKYGDVFVQYMHLTKNGALVKVGDSVYKGQILGMSGATGLAGYPHLHFVVTTSTGIEYVYGSVPVTFKNTDANPKSLESGKTYIAKPY
ncbi:M23 family metallopeptidase [Polaribacter uvawellassae]|uniref:M23 family metallopeptidase n=1 Tax=Polaribacter uvawellassae TaxID=3133495 RepID=UPI0032198327